MLGNTHTTKENTHLSMGVFIFRQLKFELKHTFFALLDSKNIEVFISL
jgi:hypothetical protein